MTYTAYKYCGGAYCGNGEFESLDAVMRFADDGFCDYVRAVSDEGQTLKIRFTPTDEKMFDTDPHDEY
jgi:hypothetical protein